MKRNITDPLSGLSWWAAAVLYRHQCGHNRRSSVPCVDGGRPRLLALDSSKGLRLYKLEAAEAEEVDTVHCVGTCTAENLLQLVGAKDLSVSQCVSLMLLWFGNGRSFVLLNSCILVQLVWDDRGASPQVLGCHILGLPQQALDNITDCQICRGTLFLLANTGHIYIFDMNEGRHLASVDLPLYNLAISGENDSVPRLSSFSLFQVSQDLATVVAVTRFNSAICVDLNNYFRRYPEHMLCCQSPVCPPLRPAGALDQDCLSSAAYSHTLLGGSFHVDCSWEARLSLLYNKARASTHQYEAGTPWYHALPQVEGKRTAEVPCAASPLVWGARLSNTEHSQAESSPAIKEGVMKFQLHRESLAPASLAVSEFSAVLTFVLPRSEEALTVLWDLQTQEVIYRHSSRLCMPVQHCGEEQLCLFLKAVGLSLLLFGVTQEELLNRLMVYGSAGTVDSLCHLNGWSRCSIPIPALKAGLKNHQLDTVDFFLKSKENILCPPANVEDLCPALDLLCSAIKETHSEAQSKQFSEQLLNITMTFLNKQVREILCSTDELDDCLQKCVDILNKYISELRIFMKKFPWTTAVRTPTLSSDHTEGSAIGLWQNWHGLSTEDVVQSAVMNNDIPQAQAFFRSVQNPAEIRALRCLSGKDLCQATALLRNMGFNVKEQLHTICLYTDDKDMRNFVVEELQKQHYLPDEEQRMVKFIKQVESLCSLPATRCKKSQSRRSGVQLPFTKHINFFTVLKHFCFLHFKSVLINADFVDYFCIFIGYAFLVSLNALLLSIFFHNAKKLVIFSFALIENTGMLLKVMKKTNIENSNLFSPYLAIDSCDSAVLWRYLTSLHDWPRISQWIQSLHFVNGKPSQPTQWPVLTADTVDRSTLCSSYMKNEILDLLARGGVFIQSELSDFEQVLWRLSQAGGIMQHSPPVPQYHSLGGPDFHTRFVLYCLENGLKYLLYVYLEHYDLNPRNCAVLADRSLYEMHPWFEMLVKMQEITRNPTDPSVIFQSSLTNAQILIPSSQASVSSMLLEGHSLLALSTIMFAPGGFDQVVSQTGEGDDSLWKVDLQLLKMALSPYPKLKSALFPQTSPRGAPPSDISIYHLLQSLHPLDPSRLFGWQSANTLATVDASAELPHFSSPHIVNKYAVIESLDFLYYLRHGRPSFAFGTFLVQQSSNTTFFREQIILAVDQAYNLGLLHFDVPSVTAACVGFCELLGVSSLKLRVDFKILNLILKHWTGSSEESKNASLREFLVEKGSLLVESERQAAGELLMHLEDAVKDSIDRKGISRSSYEAGQEWSLVVQFSQLHKLPLTSVYLQACATDNQWLHFLIFSQLHSYPPEQVRALTAQFSPELRAHLSLAFENLQLVSQWEDNRDQTPTEQAILKSEAQPPRELFQVLLQSQDKPSAWRYLLSEAMHQHCPVLTVIAACIEDVSLVQCLCVWVLTSVDDDIIAEATGHINECVKQHEWNLHDLSIIWKTLLKRQNAKPLIRGFQLFQKDCPLIYMLQMYELCWEYKNYNEAKNRLLDFQRCLMNLKTSTANASPVIPVQWAESQASSLLHIMILQCATQYELRKLLQLLADMERFLRSNGPDFKKLSLLSQILQDTPVSISQSLLEAYSGEALQRECLQIMEKLQQQGLFSSARQVAQLADLPTGRLAICEVLQDLQNLKTRRQWERKEMRIAFWKKCHDRFKSNAISNKEVSEFFLSQAEATVPLQEGVAEAELHCIQEKCLLLTMAGHWLCREDPSPVPQLEEMEKRIWICRIRQQAVLTAMEKESMFFLPVLNASDNSFEDLIKEFSFSKLAALNRPEYLQLDGLPSDKSCKTSLESTELEALSALVGQLLDEGNINEASRICRYFNFYHRDVVLVLHCRSLASGEVSASDLQPGVQTILTAGISMSSEGPSKRPSFPSTGSLGSQSSFVGDPPPEDQVVIDLKVLADECYHGKNYCKQVLSLYELSKELKCPYNEISAEESEVVLCKVLLSQQPDRYKKAKAFITVQRMQAETVAELVSREVVQGLLADTQESEPVGKQIYNPSDGKEAFPKLCGDPNIVGTKLLDKISSIPPGELGCIVELLILAHDCFSLTCHMEGIVRVLQAARHLSHTHLAHSERYSLLVRLLTGVGRYNDMTYVFDLLNQNHRFEMLLRKKVQSNSTLKTALLDYIKRCHPGDSEKHNMVALCFSMCREIGENHEGAARTQLKLIESQPWGNKFIFNTAVTPELKNSLKKVLTLLKDAAESFSKNSCVRQGMRCVKLAKLVTLQLHFLNHGQDHRVINLPKTDLLDAIISLPRFYQSFVVAEAYDFIPDWAEVLYQKVIVKGDFAYLEEFKQQRLLQASLFEEISKKFKHSKPPANANQNLKKLLKYCEDVYMCYKLAYEHGFFDVANMLLQDPKTSCYLNDRLAS
ncbi:SPTCS protein, partial [Atractosteus spatula]|nr:SPTCS protein [Atractosteus spatula]